MLATGPTGTRRAEAQLRERHAHAAGNPDLGGGGHEGKSAGFGGTVEGHRPRLLPLDTGVYVTAMASLRQLEVHFHSLGRVLLGFSGGVDSTLLAVIGARTLGADRFRAVIGRSASYPEVQYQSALHLAAEFRIPLTELDTHELDDPAYRANSPDRCYACKRELWAQLGVLAAAEGFDVIIDGTNADDLTEHRPGLRAAAAHGVRSPLAELGWTKRDVRAAARELNLPIWDAPAAPCLSSRIQYGIEVTPVRLRQVEDAEAWLRALGVTGDLRVRHRGDHASIEVNPEMQRLLRAQWAAVARELQRLGFSEVGLDDRGYRRGALLAELPVHEG